MAHQTTIDVRFAELDPYGHVNHAVYATYLEVGRTEALVECGVPLQELAAAGFQLVVTKLDMTFHAPAVAGDSLIVTTAVANLRRASGTWRQQVLRADRAGESDGAAARAADSGQERLVTGLITAAVTDTAGRPTRPPDWLFPALEPLLEGTGAGSARR